MKKSIFTSYSEDYKRIIFQVWYSNGRPLPNTLLKLIPNDVNGRKPSKQILYKWQRTEEWDIQADEMDTKAIVLSDDFLIRQKTEMLMRQAHIGFVMQQIGLQYLISGSFDSSSAAVNAIKIGADLERTSRGIGETIRKMAEMTNDELEKKIMERIQRASEAGQMVLDAEEVETDEQEE